MKLISDKENEYYVIEIDGDLDASSCILLDKAISEAVSKGEKKIIIDCSRLNYISSAGLGVFMSYLQDFENNKISMVLFNLSEKVKSVFQILGLDQLIRIVNTKEEAKASVNGL
jgi:anti-sigma B factor antagonist